MLPPCTSTNGTCENIEKEQDWEETFEDKGKPPTSQYLVNYV